MNRKKNLKVSIVMGSQSDFKTMKLAKKILLSLKVPCEVKIISAHRTPKRMYEYALNAEKNNIGVIIAGAGGSAHLPGMIAALTQIPVLGVPIESKKLKGLDSLLSIAQMPKGIPVGTLAVGEDGAINSALLAASIIAICIPKQIPKKGILFNLAYFMAAILPSLPLFPNPPGISTPDTFFNKCCIFLTFKLSESILLRLILRLFDIKSFLPV